MQEEQAHASQQPPWEINRVGGGVAVPSQGMRSQRLHSTAVVVMMVSSISQQPAVAPVALLLLPAVGERGVALRQHWRPIVMRSKCNRTIDQRLPQLRHCWNDFRRRSRSHIAARSLWHRICRMCSVNACGNATALMCGATGIVVLASLSTNSSPGDIKGLCQLHVQTRFQVQLGDIWRGHGCLQDV